MQKLPITKGKHKDGMPPTLHFVKIYFSQKGLSENDAEAFYKYYRGKKWKTKRGCPIRNWKATANNWIWTHQQKQQYR